MSALLRRLQVLLVEQRVTLDFAPTTKTSHWGSPKSITPEVQVSARKILLKWLGGDEYGMDFAARVRFTLVDVRTSYESADGMVYEFELSPRHGGAREMSNEWGRSHYVYRTPKEVVDEVATDPELAYRGMSWEEWRKIKKTGMIWSSGGYNLSGQEELTFYGDRWDTARSYAGGFAPFRKEPSRDRPGVIVAVPRRLLLSHDDRPEAIPQSELAAESPIDYSDIVAVWYVVPVRYSAGGRIELYRDRNTGRIREGSRYTPAAWFRAVPARDFQPAAEGVA